MSISNKVTTVPDEVCEGDADNSPCTQLWEEECRAFQMPHSEAEREHRAVSIYRNCRGLGHENLIP